MKKRSPIAYPRSPFMQADLSQVLACYPALPRRPRLVPHEGGFSGARVWQVSTPAGTFCLRAWPPGRPDEERLRFIHALIERVFARGFHIVPRPLRAATGETFVEHRGRLWELTRWLPGSADFSAEVPAGRLTAALEALARLHVAASSASPRASTPLVAKRRHGSEHAKLPLVPELQLRSEPAQSSPGILDRRTQLADWLAGGLDNLDLTRSAWPEFYARAVRIVELFHQAHASVRALLDDAARRPVPLQPVLKDVWRAHVLFADPGDALPESRPHARREAARCAERGGSDRLPATVTGILDFGSAAIDTVAADVARLLGSYCGDDPARWRTGLDAYESVRPLSPDERALVGAFDTSTVLMGGLVWLRWHYVEARPFARRDEVLRRLDTIVSRLHRLAAHGPQLPYALSRSHPNAVSKPLAATSAPNAECSTLLSK